MLQGQEWMNEIAYSRRPRAQTRIGLPAEYHILDNDDGFSHHLIKRYGIYEKKVVNRWVWFFLLSLKSENVFITPKVLIKVKYIKAYELYQVRALENHKM